MQGEDGKEAIKAAFKVEVPACQVVEDGYVIAFARKVECLRPAEVAVAPEYENTHKSLCSSVIAVSIPWRPQGLPLHFLWGWPARGVRQGIAQKGVPQLSTL